MKCIQSIKPTKQFNVGEIIRINDVDAELKVSGGYWKYIPKSEWKSVTRKQREESKKNVVNDQITDSVTLSEKQLKKRKVK